ncbi:replication initiation protein [Lacticaseibacillus paracasei]
MANTINKKQNLAMQALLKRQDYLVTQGNDLARAFGNLTSFEHKVLDYCFSFVKSDSKLEEAFNVSTSDILHHLGLSFSGEKLSSCRRSF